MVAEGDSDRLATLGSWFGFSDDSSFPAHGHYEWFPDHPDIAEDSLPLVVGVAKTAERSLAPRVGTESQGRL